MKKNQRRGLVFLAICAVILLADKAFDRTIVLRPVLARFNNGSPYQLSVAHVEHSILEPGRIHLSGLHFKDERGEYFSVDDIELRVAIWPLWQKKLVVENVDIGGVHGQLSGEGLARLQATKSDEAPEQQVMLPVDSVQLQQLVLHDVDLDFQQGQQRLLLRQMHLDLEAWQIVQQGQFDLARVSGAGQLAFASLDVDDKQLSDFSMSFSLTHGLLSIDSSQFSGLSGQFAAKLQVNVLAPLAVTINELNISNARFEQTLAVAGAAVAESKTAVAEPTPIAKQDTENKPQVTEQASAAPGVNVETKGPESLAESAADNNRAETPEDDALLPLNSLLLEHLRVSNGQVILHRGEQDTELSGIDAELQHLALIENHHLLGLSQLHSGGEIKLSFASVQQTALPKIQSMLQLETREGGLSLQQWQLQLPEGQISLTGELKQVEQQISSTLALNWQQLALAPLQPLFGDASILPEGVSSGQLTAQLNTPAQQFDIAKTSGKFQLSSQGTGIKGLDLDSLIDGFKASQETSLTDVGSFLLAGPLGVMAMQAAELGAGAAGMKGDTTFKDIQAHGILSNGQLELQNTKLATTGNLLGFKGQVDLVAQGFRQFSIGFLDDNGCAAIQQKLDGPFDEVKDVLLGVSTGAVTSPVSGVIGGLSNLVSGGCKPFFADESKTVSDSEVKQAP